LTKGWFVKERIRLAVAEAEVDISGEEKGL
jgi:hypothetical protein